MRNLLNDFKSSLSGSRVILAGLSLISVGASVLSILFYLNIPLSALSVLLSSIVSCVIVAFTFSPHTPPTSTEPFSWRSALGASISVACAFIVFSISRMHEVSVSIRTPWPILSSTTILIIATSWLASLIVILIDRRHTWSAVAVTSSILATLGITPFLYRFGFGFDGFLHRAAERAIVETGTLQPKPLAYIGQYFPVSAISRLTHIPVDQIDRWFLVILATILLFTLIRSLTIPSRSAFALLWIPLASFVTTTPQAVAFLLGFFSIGMIAWTDAPLIVSASTVAWACLTHPLAGVPCLFIWSAIWCFKRSWKIPGFILTGIGMIAVPALFILISRNATTSINWHPDVLFTWDAWASVARALMPWLSNQYALFPAWSSLVDVATPAVLLIVAITQWNHPTHRTTVRILLLSGICLHVIGILLSATGDFSFLISYERSNYADRLRTLGTLLLVLASFPGWDALLARVRGASGSSIASLAIVTLLCAGAQTYNALPRNDALIIGHGWSVGAADRRAAQWIENDANGQPYTVLANQSVSAAAIDLFGFKRYTAQQVFYYPIPTGGPLYTIFEELVYGIPTRDRIEEAATLGESKRVYVVLNDYWWMSDALREQLKQLADAQWIISADPTHTPSDDDPDGTRDFVYRFDFNKPVQASATTSGR